VTRAVVVVDGHGFGGAQVYARSLVVHAPRDLHCDVVTTAEHAPRLAAAVQSRGGRLVVVPTSVGAECSPELAEAVAALAPDVVQVNLIDPVGMVAALEACSAVAPTVATLHMSGPLRPGEADRVLAAYACLGHLVAVSAEFATLAATVLRLPPDRITHVVNGVDPVAPVAPPRGAVPFVGALGRLTPQKGIDVLIDAVRLLVHRRVAVRLLVGGEGRSREALEHRSRGLPVRFLGFQDGPRALLRQLDVFCVPSRAEALPLVLLEALSAGMPAVATDVGDVRLVLDGVVIIVPPDDEVALADALELLLTDERRRRELADASVAVARRSLTAERMAREAWSVFLPSHAPPR
jgi:glycosyltransferase involved in cell wall biosynthesis